MNDTNTLKMHPSEDPNTRVSHPIAVNAWVERGQRLCTLIQPKFMWRPVHRGGSGIRLDSPSVTSIDLLDFTRILKVDRIDRTRYPFAKPKHCFVIKTIDEEDFFFEAKSVMERNRIVYSLKLVVARYGAKILASDESLFRDFFTCKETAPGEPPDWAQPERLL